MSYTTHDAVNDWHDSVETAIAKRDGDALYKLAQMIDEEEAQPLLAIIARWNKEDDDDWAYDRAVDNAM